MLTLRERYRGAIVGLATGDALGAPVEFRKPGTFPLVTEMIGGGRFGLAPGQWTDDTSLALCLAESLIARGGHDPVDQLQRYTRWYREGYLSSTGSCFGIGRTTHLALQRFLRTGEPSGIAHAHRAGNGSLMRLAPVPLFFASVPELAIAMAGASSSTTHSMGTAVDACRALAELILGAVHGLTKPEILSIVSVTPLVEEIAEVVGGSYRHRMPPEIAGSGHVVRTLEAALWAFFHSDSFEEGCVLAINLGGDSDTVGAVYGQLAGAFYGVAAVPDRWRNRLAMLDTIERYADQLLERSGLTGR